MTRSHSGTKTILWDNDGVLVDTEHLYFRATQQVLQSVGIPLTEAQYVEMFLVKGAGAWHLAEERGIAPGDIEKLRDERNDLYGRLLGEAPRVIAGVVPVLERLHATYTMGIVTSSRRDHFDLIHQSTDLLQYFDFVVAAGDYARSKPDPDPYLRAVERSGCHPDACVAVEDSARGLESATRAGIRCIVVPTALTRGCCFDAAQHVVNTVAEIPALLANG